MNALWKDVLEALESALPIIQFDAQMMADITRHAPLDPESQAKHDSTEYASEHLVRTIPPLIERLKAALAEPQPEPLTPEQRAVISPAALRRYDEACKAAPQAQQPLTDEQLLKVLDSFKPHEKVTAWLPTPICFVRAIEAAHGIGKK